MRASPDRLHASSLDGIATSPLALAARAYWRSFGEARLALALELAPEAVEVIERLRDLSETGPEPVRGRATDCLPPLLFQLTRLAENRP